MPVSEPAYCPTCGTQLGTRQIEDRTRCYCSSCDHPVYQNPKPCAGVIVVDQSGSVLLVKRTTPPGVGTWSVPAGFLEVDEPPKTAAARELVEETGVAVAQDDLSLFETVFVTHPDGSHVLVVLYTTPESATAGSPVAGSDAAAARFWDLSTLREGDEEIETGYLKVLEAAVAAVTG